MSRLLKRPTQTILLRALATLAALGRFLDYVAQHVAAGTVGYAIVGEIAAAAFLPD